METYLMLMTAICVTFVSVAIFFHLGAKDELIKLKMEKIKIQIEIKKIELKNIGEI